MNRNVQRALQVVGAGTGWFAVVLQFFLLLANRTQAIGPTVVQFFSYFTILTNILVAACYTIQLFRPLGWPGVSKTTAVAVYITIVGLGYNLLLRSLWHPEGWQRVVDELLHSVNPALFVLYWALFFRGRLPWMRAFAWLLYPALYIAYLLVRAALTHVYPYPYMNIQEQGVASVLQNAFFLCSAFLLFSLLFIAIGRTGRNNVYGSAMKH